MKLIDPEILQNLVSKAITLIFELEDNDDLVRAWCKVFTLSVPQCDLDYLIEEVVPILMPLTSVTEKKLSNRLLSGEMLLEICSVYGQRAFKRHKKLVSLTFSLCGDIINWKIRQMGANRLRRIVEHSPLYLSEEPGFYDMVVDKLQDLLCDEENFVKMEALETILHCAKHISKQDFQQRLEPLIVDILRKEVLEHEEVLYSMATLCGQLMHQLQSSELEHGLRTSVIEFFEGLLNNQNDQLRKKAAYNFAYFFTQLYSEDGDSTEPTEEEFK